MKHVDSPITTEHKLEMCRQPWLHQHGFEEQAYGTVTQGSRAVSSETRVHLCQRLNQTLADTQILIAQLRKHHRLTLSREYSELHDLTKKYANEQLAAAENIAAHIRSLGGIAISDPRHIAEVAQIPRAPNGAEHIPAMLSRSLEALEYILIDALETAVIARQSDDAATEKLLQSTVMRLGKRQAWMLAEHLAKPPCTTLSRANNCA